MEVSKVSKNFINYSEDISSYWEFELKTISYHNTITRNNKNLQELTLGNDYLKNTFQLCAFQKKHSHGFFVLFAIT